jgi:hypothetical protein
LSRLKSESWVVPGTIDEGLSLAVAIAAADPTSAQSLYDGLVEPFAAYRNNKDRQVVRLLVAGRLGPERVAEALAEVEPNVVFVPGVLQVRAKSYAAIRHPLAATAQRDWEWYQRHMTGQERVQLEAAASQGMIRP